ncbi:BREX-3 system phosphatase PglZ [Pelotomaculum isophthalicicum JI]|uniref:BREX-3 system phosphatase PglZ n=1 Tax=Pelotomaculum isophthalicicum JI TaxID=947010 RepID=A0A9X4H6N0_9FIRM|nr:BREX-3 system phosphatase PglZ [Pelotomaculum isophthalicicum]MDF9408594.1 BREX-3 system phosphatase PglZ [Pelotomaculum isophthalicicum JI]
MSTWRDQVLRDFQEPVPPLTLVADPDHLLLDEVLLSSFKDSQVEFVQYGDPVAFRYLFEFSYRKALEERTLRLLVRVNDVTLEQMPYDLLQMGRKLTYRVQTIFPKLSPQVVKQLASQDLDALYAVRGQYQGAASYGETCDFILRRVFKVAYDMIDNETELVKYLLSKHYRQRLYPEVIESYLIEQLQMQKGLNKLPLAELVKSPSFFYSYLQNQWVVYLQILQEKPLVLMDDSLPKGIYGKEKPHPFDDEDVYRLLDNLFIEGYLKPVKGFNSKRLPQWTHVGLVIDPASDHKNRLKGLLVNLKEKLQAIGNYRDWLNVVPLYGEIKDLILSMNFTQNETVLSEVKAVEAGMDAQFELWMLRNYGGLLNLPYLPKPVMLHQVSHYLAAKHYAKVALVVLDGMSYVQWAQIRKHLQAKNFVFDELSVFAWIPTITSISRQALFTGEMPVYFSHTLGTTRKEEATWKLYWENHDVFKAYTGYEKRLGQREGAYRSPDSLQKPSLKVLGLVIDTIDNLVHTALQGHRGMYAELKLWLEKGYLAGLLADLMNKGFEVYLTSDHGNKESRGIGRVSEGVLAETRGERVRIYKDKMLRDKAAAAYSSLAWTGSGLPEDVYVLLAKSGEAFIQKGEHVVSHGGISLEEVVVPFIHITGKQ